MTAPVSPPGNRAARAIADRDSVGARLAHAGWTWQLLALGLLLLAWWPLSISMEPWVPTPLATGESIVELLGDGEFYDDLYATSRRIVTAFLAAGLAGVAIGLWMGLSKLAEQFFAPVVAIALAIPDPVYVMFAVLTFGVGERSTDLALVVAVTPFVVNIVRASVAARDPQLDELARVYRFGAHRRYRDVLLPQLVPALLAAGRTSFALSWKIVVVVEGMSQPTGIGAAILDSFNLLRTREVFAYAIIFTVVMQVVEQAGVRLATRRAMAWRS
jgi:NitT/TauT family transport system permease protein